MFYLGCVYNFINTSTKGKFGLILKVNRHKIYKRVFFYYFNNTNVPNLFSSINSDGEMIGRLITAK